MSKRRRVGTRIRTKNTHGHATLCGVTWCKLLFNWLTVLGLCVDTGMDDIRTPEREREKKRYAVQCNTDDLRVVCNRMETPVAPWCFMHADTHLSACRAFEFRRIGGADAFE